MQIKIVFSILIIICLFLGTRQLCLQTKYPVNSVLKGTFIIAIPSKEGLVICADKRVHSLDNKINNDSEQKIFPLGERAIYAFNGNTAIQNKNNLFGSRSFNLSSIINHYFIGKNLNNIEQYIFPSSNTSSNSLMSLLNRDFKSELDSKMWEMRSEFEHSDIEETFSEKPLYEILIFYLNSDNEIKAVSFYCLYTRFFGSFSHKVGMNVAPANIFLKNTPTGFAQKFVLDELQKPQNKEFDKFRSEQLIQEFISKEVPVDNIPKTDALAFGQYIIKLTSENGKSLNSQTSVSPNCDCAILSYKDEFKWLAKNETYTEAKLPYKCNHRY